MKILQVINGLATGGAERLLSIIIPCLNDKGHSVDLLLLNGKETPFLRELRKTKSCNIFYLGHSYYNPYYIIKIIPYLRKYDVVHVHLFPSQYFVALAKIFVNKEVKSVFTEHSTSNRRMQLPFLRPLERFIYSKYQSIVCITDQVKDAIQKNVSSKTLNKLITINNGVSIDLINNVFPANRTEFGYNESDILLIMVAAFRHEKDHLTLFKTLSLLPDKYKLLLLGDGKERDRITEEITQCKIVGRVNMLGIRNDVFSVLKMGDISILSSHWEGFGLAAVESMACGIPTIASNVAGLADVVGDGGLLFKYGDVDDLKNKILSLEDREYYLKMKEAGKIKSKKYDLGNMIDNLIHLYEKDH